MSAQTVYTVQTTHVAQPAIANFVSRNPGKPKIGNRQSNS